MIQKLQSQLSEHRDNDLVSWISCAEGPRQAMGMVVGKDDVQRLALEGDFH